MRSFVESTAAFEAWMRKRTDVSKRLLKKKHSQMADGPFPFLRATFYRWVEQWPRVCPELAERDEDVLLAVGDLHVANFGVWADSRKRHVWGLTTSTKRANWPSPAISCGSRPAPCSPRRCHSRVRPGGVTGFLNCRSPKQCRPFYR